MTHPPVPEGSPAFVGDEPPDAHARRRSPLLVAIAAVAAVAVLVLAVAGPRPLADAPSAAGASRDAVRIVGGAPTTWDPAAAGSAETAGVLAQVFEGLTTFDAQARVQPALATSWSFDADGTTLTFRLRAGITFSDGSPIRAADVVASWLRLIDPQQPSPLSSLLSDVRGAREYLRGEGTADAVGVRAEGDDRVIVSFRRPATYFVAVTASPSLAVIPPGSGPSLRARQLPAGIVVSGAYRPAAQTPTGIQMEANERYWAGRPPIPTVTHVTDLEGSPVDAFTKGTVDYAPVGGADASWIKYDRDLGPQLREIESLSVDYYGFDTTRPPFDDARVRRAFGQAVDWDRLVRLADPTAVPATSIVPPGIAGRGDEDFSPPYDPAAARSALAQAGFPGGRGFPEVTLETSGYGYDAAVAKELREVLGVTVHTEAVEFEAYFRRLETEPPRFWALSWIADYPAPQDFLGLLLETGGTTNYGGWSNAAYDAELEAAARTSDPAEQERRYAAAQRIVQREVPVIPVSYGRGWALSRTGLLGAEEGGVGFVRYAGLAWAP